MPTERLVAGVEARFRGVVTTVQYAGGLLTVQEDGVATWVAVPPDLARGRRTDLVSGRTYRPARWHRIAPGATVVLLSTR